MSAQLIEQLRLSYIALHEEALRRIRAAPTQAAALDDLQAREDAITRELRALGTSLSAVMTRGAH